MKWLIQNLILRVYKLVLASGFLSTSLGRSIMNFSYNLYKRWFEASYVSSLQQFVRPNSIIIDVGANTGFFTRYFAEWIKDSGLVIAIEPDPENFAQLEQSLKQNQLSNYVECICAAVSDTIGQAKLNLDPDNPANHKLGTDGIEVKTVTVDSLVKKHNKEVSFIKIDVQGAELLVLHGARETIAQYHPNMIVEIHAPSLADFAVTPQAVLGLLQDSAYQFYLLNDGQLTEPLSIENLLSKSENYLDVICLWQPS